MKKGTKCIAETDHSFPSLRLNVSYIYIHINEPPREKTNNLHMRKQRRRSGNREADAFVFATRIVQFLFYLNPKFQASSLLL